MKFCTLTKAPTQSPTTAITDCAVEIEQCDIFSTWHSDRCQRVQQQCAFDPLALDAVDVRAGEFGGGSDMLSGCTDEMKQQRASCCDSNNDSNNGTASADCVTAFDTCGEITSAKEEKRVLSVRLSMCSPEDYAFLDQCDRHSAKAPRCMALRTKCGLPCNGCYPRLYRDMIDFCAPNATLGTGGSLRVSALEALQKKTDLQRESDVTSHFCVYATRVACVGVDRALRNSSFSVDELLSGLPLACNESWFNGGVPGESESKKYKESADRLEYFDTIDTLLENPRCFEEGAFHTEYQDLCRPTMRVTDTPVSLFAAATTLPVDGTAAVAARQRLDRFHHFRSTHDHGTQTFCMILFIVETM